MDVTSILTNILIYFSVLKPHVILFAKLILKICSLNTKLIYIYVLPQIKKKLNIFSCKIVILNQEFITIYIFKITQPTKENLKD